MPIAENALIEFYGTQDDLSGTSTAVVADAAFSTINATSGMNSWTNDDDALMARVTLIHQYTSTAPDNGSVINLYARKLNIEGTRDDPVPSAINTGNYVGGFMVDGDAAYNTDQALTATISLQNFETSQEYEFYFENSTGQQIATTWEFFITPVTVGPHSA